MTVFVDICCFVTEKTYIVPNRQINVHNDILELRLLEVLCVCFSIRQLAAVWDCRVAKSTGKCNKHLTIGAYGWRLVMIAISQSCSYNATIIVHFLAKLSVGLTTVDSMSTVSMFYIKIMLMSNDCGGQRKLRFTNKSFYSISQEICTRFLLCCALLWLYIDWFSHIHQAYFTGTVAI